MDASQEIRYLPATPEYAASYGEAVDSVARERLFLAATVGFPTETSIDFVRTVWENNLPQYFAIAGETVVGWCDILPKQYEGMTHVGVLGMGVRKEYRRRGIGRELLRLCLRHAQKICGLEKVELEVFASNRAAITLYEKMGFIHEGALQKARKLDGYCDDIVLMAKFLAAADPTATME